MWLLKEPGLALMEVLLFKALHSHVLCHYFGLRWRFLGVVLVRTTYMNPLAFKRAYASRGDRNSLQPSHADFAVQSYINSGSRHELNKP